ncbi:hypothetical protein U746_0033 [Mycolicibacterium mucogenicum 261Sha1.1M5]|nr:hypothetical protein U746_0033 [Mycolicibacterium mucogenicum 261Sha1.1M5]
MTLLPCGARRLFAGPAELDGGGGVEVMLGPGGESGREKE